MIARLFLAVCAASLILVSSVVAGESPSKPSLAAAFAVPVSRATASVGASPAGAVTIPLYASFAAPAGWGWTANNITEPGPTLTVRQGDVITFQLFSNDTMQHQLIIDLDNSHTNTTGDAFSLPFSSKTTATVFTYTASTVGTFAYFCNIHGYNAQHGQLVVNGPPSAPISLAAAAGNGLVALTWQAPASNGGSAVTSYKVYRSTTAGSEVLLTTLGNVLTYMDSSVTNGQTYFYQVTATNGLGEGPKSTEASATPATAPTMPRSLAAAAGLNEATLTWAAPVSDGGSPITGYKVYRATYAGAETLLSTVGVVLSYTNPGLTNGQAYYYEVSAVNAVGEGPKSNEASATPTAPPDTTPPTITITSPANNTEVSSTTVTVSGTATDNVAVAKIEISTDGLTWTTASGTTTWTAEVTLHVGSNTIYVRATDGSGNQATTRITVVVTSPTTGALGLPLPLIAGFGVVVALVAIASALLVNRRRRSRIKR